MIQIFLSISLIIYLISLIIVSIRREFGYLPIFFCLYFIFVLIIPAYFHVENNVFPFYNLSYSYEEQFNATIVLLIFSSFFWFGFFVNNHKVIRFNRILAQDKKVNNCRFFFTIWLIIVFLIIFLMIYGVDTFLVKRSEFSREAFGSDSSVRELLINISRWSSFALLFFMVIFRKNVNKIVWFFTTSIVSILFFILNFPLALPRFVFFSYLIAFFCFYFRPNFKNKVILIFIFASGITTIFPYFSYITRGEGSFTEVMNDYYKTSGDFDGFQSIINVVKFNSNQGYTYGNQILSSILSFIPRSVWSGKSEPTGVVASSAAGYDFLNISAPLPAEFYVDFGFVGVIIFSFFLGFILRKVDKYYILSNSLNIKYLLSIVFISMIVILARGSLLAVINNLYAIVGIFILIYSMIFLRIKV